MTDTLEGALAERQVDGIVAFEGAIEIDETHLVLDPDITWERYESICRFAGRLARASAWWVGDLINQGEALWGEKYAQAVDLTGLSPDTLQNYSYVSRKIPFSSRRPDLSFGHHEAVAKFLPQEQEQWLDRAADEGLSRSQLREAIREDAAEEPRDRPQLVDAAKAVSAQAVKRGSHYSVPLEPMARLRAALGEE